MIFVGSRRSNGKESLGFLLDDLNTEFPFRKIAGSQSIRKGRGDESQDPSGNDLSLVP